MVYLECLGLDKCRGQLFQKYDTRHSKNLDCGMLWRDTVMLSFRKKHASQQRSPSPSIPPTLALQSTLDILVTKKIQHRALSVVASANVKEALLLELNEIKATTLIVGSRGSDFATRSLIGGVSDYLAHHVKIPVLIVKPTEEEVAKWGVPKHHVAALRVDELTVPIYPV
ncbi:UNVERIFIED_CONTAM: hypothetical protein HDU68_008655 [Siphonaria sp. JEL0065]|nr:hypothetical protein HDU68_008655 [Siphonaria sp. JEL0065]